MDNSLIQYEELIEQINNKLLTYLSLKDAIMESDYFEAFEDSFPIVKPMISGYKLIYKKRLVHFLKGFNLEQEPTNNQLKKLSNYIDSEEKAEFISENIAKILKSKSQKASFLIGIIVHRIINSNSELTYKELISVNALSNMYDFDIYNIGIISRYIIYLDEKKKGKYKGWFGIERNFEKWCEENHINIEGSLSLTVEKGVASQIFIKEIDVELDIDDDQPGNASAYNTASYKFTEAGEVIVDNLKYLRDL